MKKLIFTLVALGIAGSAAFAQISYGFKAGVNLSKEKFDINDGNNSSSTTSDNRLSLHFGGFLVKTFSEKLAIQPEFVISFEGGKEEGEFQGVDYKSVDKLSFLNIPILLRFSPVEKFNLYAGPQIGISIGAKNETEFDGATEEEDIEDFSSLGLGLGLGAGFYATEDIEISFRYNAGLSNWYNGENSDDIKVKVNTIQISVAYKLQ